MSEYHISKSGRDSNPGTLALPWLTLQKGGISVRAGDHCLIHAGEYLENSSWGYGHPGTPEARIKIAAFPGDKVIVDGQNQASWHDSGSGYLQVYSDYTDLFGDIEVRRSGEQGIIVYGENCTVKGVLAKDNWGWGILMIGSQFLVEDSFAHHNSLGNEFAALPIGWGGGMTTGPKSAKGIFRRCRSWENWGEGFILSGGGFHLAEENVGYNNYQNLYLTNSRGNTARKNLLYCTPGNMMEKYISQGNILIGIEGASFSSGHLVTYNLCLGGRMNFYAGANSVEDSEIAFNTFVNANPYYGDAACVAFLRGAYSNLRYHHNVALEENPANEIAHIECQGIKADFNCWSRIPVEAMTGVSDINADPLLAKVGPTGPGELTVDWFRPLAKTPAAGMGALEPFPPPVEPPPPPPPVVKKSWFKRLIEWIKKILGI